MPRIADRHPYTEQKTGYKPSTKRLLARAACKKAA